METAHLQHEQLTHETPNFRRIRARIVELSIADTWLTAACEWDAVEVFEDTAGECLCGHAICENIRIARIDDADATVIIGNHCISRFNDDVLERGQQGIGHLDDLLTLSRDVRKLRLPVKRGTTEEELLTSNRVKPNAKLNERILCHAREAGWVTPLEVRELRLRHADHRYYAALCLAHHNRTPLPSGTHRYVVDIHGDVERAWVDLRRIKGKTVQRYSLVFDDLESARPEMRAVLAAAMRMPPDEVTEAEAARWASDGRLDACEVTVTVLDDGSRRWEVV